MPGVALGRGDGFDQEDRVRQYERALILRGLLGSNCDAHDPPNIDDRSLHPWTGHCHVRQE